MPLLRAWRSQHVQKRAQAASGSKWRPGRGNQQKGPLQGMAQLAGAAWFCPACPRSAQTHQSSLRPSSSRGVWHGSGVPLNSSTSLGAGSLMPPQTLLLLVYVGLLLLAIWKISWARAAGCP